MDEIKTKLIQDLKALENELDKFRKIRAKTIDLLKQVAQDLDDRKQNCNIAKVTGSSVGILGGLATITGAVCTLTGVGAILGAPLLAVGTTSSVLGAGTNIGTSITESSLNTSNIRKANEAMKKDFDAYENLQKKVDGVILGLHQLDSSKNSSWEKKAFDFIQGVSVSGHSALLRVILGRNAATKVLKTTTSFLGSGGGLARAAKASADSAKFATKTIIPLAVVGVVLDGITLGTAIGDLVKQKGHEASEHLRKVAKQLEANLNDLNKDSV